MYIYIYFDYNMDTWTYIIYCHFCNVTVFFVPLLQYEWEFLLFNLSSFQYHFNPHVEHLYNLQFFPPPYNVKKATPSVFPADRWQILLLTVPLGIAAPRLEWSDQVRWCGGRWTGKRWKIHDFCSTYAWKLWEILENIEMKYIDIYIYRWKLIIYGDWCSL